MAPARGLNKVIGAGLIAGLLLGIADSNAVLSVTLVFVPLLVLFLVGLNLGAKEALTATAISGAILVGLAS